MLPWYRKKALDPLGPWRALYPKLDPNVLNVSNGTQSGKGPGSITPAEVAQEAKIEDFHGSGQGSLHLAKSKVVGIGLAGERR